jgi:hypothetical protein
MNPAPIAYGEVMLRCHTTLALDMILHVRGFAAAWRGVLDFHDRYGLSRDGLRGSRAAWAIDCELAHELANALVLSAAERCRCGEPPCEKLLDLARGVRRVFGGSDFGESVLPLLWKWRVTT